ncbi:MAG: TIR domain-containing protein [Oscillospiraceae bacterium]
MPSLFKPYEGSDPYIFISYAHADADAVLEIVGDMHDRGYRIWYDEGIDAGSEWTECIASHLYGAHLVLAFVSPAYLASDNCRKELHYALTKKKKTISIFLEETQLSPGMELQLGNIFALMKYTYPSEDYFYDKLYTAPLLRSEAFADAEAETAPPEAPAKPKKGKKKAERSGKAKNREKKAERSGKTKKGKAGKIIAACLAVVLLGCAIAAVIVGHFTGYLERWTTKTVAVETLPSDTVCAFQNPILEQAARDYAGIPAGELTVDDLKGLTALYVCGNTVSFTKPETEGMSAERGSIRELSDLAYFPSLTTVWLRNQNITSLRTLPACAVETLDVSGNRITALAGIENLPKLQTLLADGNAIADLTGLERCLDLRTVSLNGANASELSVFRPLTKLQSLTISNATREELWTPLHQASLTYVALYDCDLRGSFFKSFDKERGITELVLVGCRLDSTSRLERFTGLTALTLLDCTGELDWSPLAGLPNLRTITTDAAGQSALAASGTAAEIVVQD